MSPSPKPLKPAFVLLFALATVHLLIVIVGSGHLTPFAPKSTPGRIYQAYGTWTGATSTYAFFAPKIDPAHLASVDLTLPSGEVVHEPISFTNEALDAYTYSMVKSFLLRAAREDEQDDMARAWAATMFDRHPEAREATIRIERMELPTLSQYQSGERPTWKQIYRADLASRAPSSLVRATLP